MDLGHTSAALPGVLAGSWITEAAAGMQSGPSGDAAVTDTCYATRVDLLITILNVLTPV